MVNPTNQKSTVTSLGPNFPSVTWHLAQVQSCNLVQHKVMHSIDHDPRKQPKVYSLSALSTETFF